MAIIILALSVAAAAVTFLRMVNKTMESEYIPPNSLEEARQRIADNQDDRPPIAPARPMPKLLPYDLQKDQPAEINGKPNPNHITVFRRSIY